jgi:hypothetical protein
MDNTVKIRRAVGMVFSNHYYNQTKMVINGLFASDHWIEMPFGHGQCVALAYCPAKLARSR